MAATWQEKRSNELQRMMAQARPGQLKNKTPGSYGASILSGGREVLDKAKEGGESIGNAYNEGGFGAAAGQAVRTAGSVVGETAKQLVQNRLGNIAPAARGIMQFGKTLTTGDPTPIEYAWTTGGEAQAAEPPPPAPEPAAPPKQEPKAAQAAAGPDASAPDQDAATGLGMMDLVREIPGRDGQPAIGVYQGKHGLVYQMGQPGQPNYGWAQKSGQAATTGQAQAQLGVNGIGNYQLPGAGGAYSFTGNAADAARFFQPVPHGGGYNPYKQSFRTLFDEQMDARRAAQNAPSQAEPQGPMGWKRLRDQMNNESRERIAEMTGGFGLTQAGMQDVRAREEMMRRFGLEGERLRQAGIGAGLDNATKRLALNQAAQVQQLQHAWLNSTDPAERQQLQEQIAVLSGQGVKEQEQKLIETGKIVNPETGNEEKQFAVMRNGVLTPVQMEGQGGGDNRDYSLSDKEKKAIAERITDKNMKAAFERDPEGFMRSYAEIMGL